MQNRIYIKNKIIYLIITTLIVVSCKDDFEKKKVLLSNDVSKCWDLIVEGDNTYIPKGRCYCFYRNNKYSEYYYSKTNKRIRYNYYDQVFSDEWFFKNDSVLIMSGFENKIIELTENSLVIINSKNELMKLITCTNYPAPS